MKKFFWIILCANFLLPREMRAQTFAATDNSTGEITQLQVGQEKKLYPATWTISADNAAGKKFEVLIDGQPQTDVAFKPPNDAKQDLELTEEKIRGKRVTIRETGQTTDLITISFTGDAPTGGVATRGNTPIAKTASEWVLTKYDGKLSPTNYGLIISESNFMFSGIDYVHLFFDGSGNSIITTVPQGISNKQYVVRIVYLSGKTAPYKTTYSVKQKTGAFEDKLVFLRSPGEIPAQLKAGIEAEWNEEVILLSTSTTDIEFDIIQTTISFTNERTTVTESKTLASHKIKLSAVYHGAFNVGLFNSRLANPSYELAALPADATKKTVVEKNAGNRGIAAVMAVLYASPVILVEKIADKQGKIPNYKLYGRNFLDDHRWYERIYPAVGVRANEKVFENLFFGANVEIARGGSFFIGAHYAKVNVFQDKFNFGQEAIVEDAFKARLDTAWKWGLAFGANIDILIVTSLFK